MAQNELLAQDFTCRQVFEIVRKKAGCRFHSVEGLLGPAHLLKSEGAAKILLRILEVSLRNITCGSGNKLRARPRIDPQLRQGLSPCAQRDDKEQDFQEPHGEIVPEQHLSGRREGC